MQRVQNGGRRKASPGCMQPESLEADTRKGQVACNPKDRIKLALDEGPWCKGGVMGMLLFNLFLFGPFLVGTLSAGKTRSVAKMMGWGIVALLPLTLC